MATARIIVQNLCIQRSNLIKTESTRFLANALQNAPNLARLQQNTCLPILSCWRFSHTFLSRLTADQLWKGVTSVSSAGLRKGRGRGSGKKFARDLNRGQVIGFGKKNMLWPGLTGPVVQGREILRQLELPPDETREKRLFELRDKFAARKSFKVHPLERGWSSNKLPGRSLGPPDYVGEDTFEGFDSRVLEFKTVMHMDGDKGRFRTFSAVVCVGNKNGLAGFALSKSVNGLAAARNAKNRAAKNLRYIKLDNGTVLHDFFSEYGAVQIFVKRRPEGHGIVAHRVIKAICEMIGIKDLHAKVEGPTNNYQALIKAFFIGLMRQKSPQQIANEKGLHIVELRENQDNFPVVVASPEKCRTEEEIEPTEQLDFELHLHNGRVEAPRKKFQPFFVNFPSYIKEMKDRERLRNQKDVKINLIAKYGAIKSFVQVRDEKKAAQDVKQLVEKA